MTTTMRLLPVRVSAAVRALVDRSGPVNAATRALLLLGAHAAGYPLDGLEREVARLLAEELDHTLLVALRRLYNQLTDEPQGAPRAPAAFEPITLVAPGDTPVAPAEGDELEAPTMPPHEERADVAERDSPTEPPAASIKIDITNGEEPADPFAEIGIAV